MGIEEGFGLSEVELLTGWYIHSQIGQDQGGTEFWKGGGAIGDVLQYNCVATPSRALYGARKF